ncbi:DUF5994 family protein [Nocardioides nitrophenolicus]|uniref:DUF5994 family protein n=1 Tax=Nocardioides nitrophenolicus TaxID=60489 RepID=UPI00195C43C3|nr:DUF5994 family protein [Nocardioides nitrophenolicus]MBM7518258.1 hypothetical protein [Nocardioides nitrophenolicus]
MTEESHLAVADGIWLPYGRDLVREGAHLVDEFPERRGRIDRLAYPRSDWEDAASEIFTRHGRIKVGLLPQARGGGIVLVRLHTSEVLRIRAAWPGRIVAERFEQELRSAAAEEEWGPRGTVGGDWSP